MLRRRTARAATLGTLLALALLCALCPRFSVACPVFRKAYLFSSLRGLGFGVTTCLSFSFLARENDCPFLFVLSRKVRVAAERDNQQRHYRGSDDFGLYPRPGCG